MVLDGISFVKDTVYSYTQQPTKAISNWATDQVAPTYWKPNHKIIVSKFEIFKILGFGKVSLSSRVL